MARFQALADDCQAGGWEDMGRVAANTVGYARSHRDVVAKWGRFPHRNAILGRQNTAEEAEGLAAGTIPAW